MAGYPSNPGSPGPSGPSSGRPEAIGEIGALVRAVAGAAAGETQAIDAWFRAEHPRVYRLCFGFLANAAEAEDAAQDAMLQLLDNLNAWDPLRPYPAWRTACVLNLCRDRRRKDEARLRAEERAASERLPENLPSPHGQDADEQREEVRHVLQASRAQLSPREREVFVLKDLEGQATRDVSATLGIAEGSVRSLLTLARRRLRQLLGERLPEVAGPAGGRND
jgi:RNA polymerase sigma factor (sigma-70 family)